MEACGNANDKQYHACDRETALRKCFGSGRTLHTISSATRPEMKPRKTVSTAHMPILHGGSTRRLDKSAMKRIVNETVRVIPLLATINKAVGAMAKKDDRRRLAATTASAILRRTPASTLRMKRTVKRTTRAAGKTMSHISSLCHDWRPAYETESMVAKHSTNIDTSNTITLSGGKIPESTLISCEPAWQLFFFNDRPSEIPANRDHCSVANSESVHGCSYEKP